MLRTLRSRSARLVAGVALLAAVAGGCVFTPAPAPSGRHEAFPTGSSYSDRTERELFDLINASRRDARVASLAWHDRLGGLAAEWSEHMASTGRFEHRDLNATIRQLPGFRRLAENILVGSCTLTGAQIHQSLMNSTTHRNNILSANFNRVGIGVVCGSDGRVWVTENFGQV